MKALQPTGSEIIRLLHVEDADMVLDVAAGTGEPGLTIATMLTDGKVVISDLSENMLAIAKESAAKRGIRNVEIHVCDACDLPFADNTFDAVSCRLGFMFFPDMLLAAKQMFRVLKPGGRIATSVWNAPEKNFWATAISGSVMKNMQLSPPPPEAPGLFRCAKNGLIQGLFKQAGFKNTSEKEVTGHLDFESIDVYWNMITEVTPPLVEALGNADDATKQKVKNEVYQTVEQRYPDGNISMDAHALVIYGEK